jgi:hypothetical protein
MTEVTHWRCDRCDVDAIHHFLDKEELHWARCSVGLKEFHFCPNVLETNYGVYREATMTDAILDFLREKFARLDTRLDGIERDIRSLRDDLRVTTAMVMRCDHTLTDLLVEVHAIHKWMAGANDPIRKLEEAKD